jgi:transposase InsO family protein
MPFTERSKVAIRQEFVVQAVKDGANIRHLCRRYEVTRKTGYKWLRRFQDEGEAGLPDRSRRPHNSPIRTSDAIEQLVVELREKHPAWGARKLKRRLENQGHTGIPAASTINEVLRRHGMIDPLEAAKHAPCKRFEHDAPNDLAQMDFKGHFPVGNIRCHPLTMLDDHSRFLLILQACPDERLETVKGCLTAAFRRYGLPWAILTDNGAPWAQVNPERSLTRLEVWLISMGIELKKSRICHPQTIGKEERFHRSLKAEVIQGNTFRDLGECQEEFDRWRYTYNHERPHEALDMGVPADRYRPSPRDFPEVRPTIEYSSNDFVRKADEKGLISFKGRRYRVGKSLAGQPVAVRPTSEDGVYDIYYCRQKVSQINQHPCPPMGGQGC